MDMYRVGILGYGGFGQFLHHAWQKMDVVEVAAVAEDLGILILQHASTIAGTQAAYQIVASEASRQLNKERS